MEGENWFTYCLSMGGTGLEFSFQNWRLVFYQKAAQDLIWAHNRLFGSLVALMLELCNISATSLNGSHNKGHRVNNKGLSWNLPDKNAMLFCSNFLWYKWWFVHLKSSFRGLLSPAQLWGAGFRVVFKIYSSLWLDYTSGMAFPASLSMGMTGIKTSFFSHHQFQMLQNCWLQHSLNSRHFFCMLLLCKV